MMTMNGLTSLTKIKQSKGVEWEEEIFEPRPKKGVGRPVKNPFHTVECEEDFIRRCRNMVERYYHPTPNTYSDFVFAARKKASKTRFWAMIFIYYMEEKGMDENYSGFIERVVSTLGNSVICDRTTLGRTIKGLQKLYITIDDARLKDMDKDVSISDADMKARQKYRKQYVGVVRYWEECLG